mmetsp:Transcript_25841/g.72083  ORF Transcript_25841/g.72083 Transcript_25841/m.72083 type:complete len:231 (-) Transcript_25841:38-730(-)
MPVGLLPMASRAGRAHVLHCAAAASHACGAAAAGPGLRRESGTRDAQPRLAGGRPALATIAAAIAQPAFQVHGAVLLPRRGAPLQPLLAPSTPAGPLRTLRLLVLLPDPGSLGDGCTTRAGGPGMRGALARGGELAQHRLGLHGCLVGPGIAQKSGAGVQAGHVRQGAAVLPVGPRVLGARGEAVMPPLGPLHQLLHRLAHPCAHESAQLCHVAGRSLLCGCALPRRRAH